jgi:hypothetical protein
MKESDAMNLADSRMWMGSLTCSESKKDKGYLFVRDVLKIVTVLFSISPPTLAVVRCKLTAEVISIVIVTVLYFRIIRRVSDCPASITTDRDGSFEFIFVRNMAWPIATSHLELLDAANLSLRHPMKRIIALGGHFRHTNKKPTEDSNFTTKFLMLLEIPKMKKCLLCRSG